MPSDIQRHEPPPETLCGDAHNPTPEELNDAKPVSLDQFLSREPSIIRVEVINTESHLRTFLKVVSEISQIIGAVASVIVLYMMLYPPR